MRKSSGLETLVPGIALRLREQIFHGDLRPGDHLSQQALADRLGASLIPVREALRLLEGEGLVQFVPHCGAQVTPVTAQEVREWHVEIVAILSALLRLSAPRMSQEAFDRLYAIDDAARGHVPTLEEQLELWSLLLEPSGMPSLCRRVSQLVWRYGRYVQTGAMDIMREYLDIHPNRRDLLDACQSRDPERIERTLVEFLGVRTQAYIRLLEAREAAASGQ